MKNRLSLDRLFEIREHVLKGWPTGREVHLEEAITWQQAIPPQQRFATVMKRAHDEGRTLLQPRAGVALVEEHVRLLRYLESRGEADLLPTTIDAYTRSNRYEEAAAGIEKSKTAGTSLLNGFPAVNHGVAGCRHVTSQISKPIQIRHGTPDARLLAEITLAGGFTSFEGGGISYNIPYAKKVPLRRSIADWQYVDRLVGFYEEQGVRINREPFGPLTGTLIPPFIGNAISILEGLLALEQGVKSITLGYGQGGNMIQDIAAVRALREQADEMFRAAGYTDYELTIAFHQWMGGFPEEEARAFGVICWGAVVGTLARADKIIVKSPHEAMGVPTTEANAAGLLATRQVLTMLEDQKLAIPAHLVDRETTYIKLGVKNLLDAVFALAPDNLAEAVAAAFEAGILDVPFAPSIYARGKVMPVRDNEGFIRVLHPGGLPLSQEFLEYQQERLAERGRVENRKPSLSMVTDDIYAISKGRLVGRPR